MLGGCRTESEPPATTAVKIPTSASTLAVTSTAPTTTVASTGLVVSPSPTPTGTTTVSPNLAGMPAISSNFDINRELVTLSSLPKSGSPDVVGAFRFLCMPGQISYDDPIIYPGKPGAAHLHQFFGNTKANAYSTYSTLRAAGDSTCMSPLNRSAYWMPAMLDGKGSVVRPDYVSIYYKRRPKSSPKCQVLGGSAKGTGICVDTPNGIKFVFGFDPTSPQAAPTGAAYFTCSGTGAVAGKWKTIRDALGKCPVGARLGAVINAPKCWDGKNLDTPNHRSHMAYTSYGSWGYERCPTTHPYVIPTFTMGAWFKVDANLKTWSLASDHMLPGALPGQTFHADFFMAWDPVIKKMWHENCIDKLLNCSDGVLGNGKKMQQSWPKSFTATPRLVPVPPHA